MDQETGVTFKTNQLDVTATIKDVTKIYGQATDSHKCDSLSGCDKDNAVKVASNAATNNEDRLEYNFDVTGALVDDSTGVVILAKAVDGNYYTQTGLPEYKNIHLGLSVVRKQTGNTTCLIKDDKFGCEDVDTYELVFRKISSGIFYIFKFICFFLHF